MRDMNYGICAINLRNKRLEPDVDTTFEQAGILADLRVGNAEGLVQDVPGVQNRLEPGGQHPESWQVLRNRKTERRIVVVHQSLVGIELGNAEAGVPAINRSDFRLRGGYIRFESHGHRMKFAPEELRFYVVDARDSLADSWGVHAAIADARFKGVEF